MTEKIARRGVRTPDSFEPDNLEMITVKQVLKENGLVLSEETSIREVRKWLKKEEYRNNYFIVTTDEGEYRGILSSSNLFHSHENTEEKIGSLIKRKPISITIDTTLRRAVQMMAEKKVDVLPVVSEDNNNVIGILSYHDIIEAYRTDDNIKNAPDISLKKRGFRILLRGQRIFNRNRDENDL